MISIWKTIYFPMILARSGGGSQHRHRRRWPGTSCVLRARDCGMFDDTQPARPAPLLKTKRVCRTAAEGERKFLYQ